MTILLVDDHAIVRAGLHRLLGALPAEIAECASGEEALALLAAQVPELVLLDLNLPGIGGLELLRRLLRDHPGLNVLVLSMHAEPLYAARALEAGARGYVSKNAPPEHILEAVRRVTAGRVYIEHEMAQELAFESLTAAANPLYQLSPRDVEILRLLAEGNSLTEIAQAIGVSYKTVANHCSRLKARLATPRMADLIRLAISYGLSFGSAPPAASLAEKSAS